MGMPEWPDHIEWALERLSLFHSETAWQYARQFQERFGSFGYEALMEAVMHGLGRERLFALWALGGMGRPDAQAILSRFLTSSVRAERWASAISLGQAGNTEAFPVLGALLTETEPHPESASWSSATESGDEDAYRGWAAEIMGAHGDASCAPYLRKVLKSRVAQLGQEAPTELTFETLNSFAFDNNAVRASWRADPGEAANAMAEEPVAYERIEQSETLSAFISWMRTVRGQDIATTDSIALEDEVLYALGRLGVFGALTGIEVGVAYRLVWMMHLAVGSLHDQFSWRDTFDQDASSPFATAIRSVLQARFGLDEQEAALAYRLYEDTKSGFLALKWQETGNGAPKPSRP